MRIVTIWEKELPITIPTYEFDKYIIYEKITNAIRRLKKDLRDIGRIKEMIEITKKIGVDIKIFADEWVWLKVDHGENYVYIKVHKNFVENENITIDNIPSILEKVENKIKELIRMHENWLETLKNNNLLVETEDIKIDEDP